MDCLHSITISSEAYQTNPEILEEHLDLCYPHRLEIRHARDGVVLEVSYVPAPVTESVAAREHRSRTVFPLPTLSMPDTSLPSVG